MCVSVTFSLSECEGLGARSWRDRDASSVEETREVWLLSERSGEIPYADAKRSELKGTF